MLIWMLTCTAFADEPADYIAQVEANLENGSLNLTFDEREFSQTVIRRRSLGSSDGWTQAEVVAELGEVSSWTDTDALPGEVWEYKISRSGDGSATGYITAAFEAELVDDRGEAVLIIDSAIEPGLSAELAQLRWDLVGDGWTLSEHIVDSNDAPEEIRAILQEENNPKAVILIGHVPVPYSGEIYPDGHSNHQGAWPADTYYADLNGIWTDQSVNNTSASREANHNTPGDGRFDQSAIPSNLELQVGRIDMVNLPTFAEDELTLLKRYFRKNHAWRHGEVEAEHAVVIDDGFGVYAPGSFTGWLLSPVVGRDALIADDFLSTLTVAPYLFGYGSGAGTYSSASGVATTSDFASQPTLGVFLMIFGSYHGDWDSEDNLLRASIAGEGNAISSVWGGRPAHQHHALGSGQTIGFAVKNTQNSYESISNMDFAARGIHTALLGDPTLHAFPVSPAQSLSASSADDYGSVLLTWSPSSDPDILGYHIYRSSEAMGPYDRITAAPVSDTIFTDELPAEGSWWWMLRGVKLETTPSGAFYNASQGIFTNIEVECSEADCVLIEEDEPESNSKGSSCGHIRSSSNGGSLALMTIFLLCRRKYID